MTLSVTHMLLCMCFVIHESKGSPPEQSEEEDLRQGRPADLDSGKTTIKPKYDAIQYKMLF